MSKSPSPDPSRLTFSGALISALNTYAKVISITRTVGPIPIFPSRAQEDESGRLGRLYLVISAIVPTGQVHLSKLGKPSGSSRVPWSLSR